MKKEIAVGVLDGRTREREREEVVEEGRKDLGELEEERGDVGEVEEERARGKGTRGRGGMEAERWKREWET